MSSAERIRALFGRAAPQLERVVFLAVLVLGVVVAGRYLWVAYSTVAYPYHLEWMEGGSVETAARLLAGRSIYPEPSLAYVGYIYTPFYYLVAAGSCLLFGKTLFACRLVSLLATLGTSALLFQFLRREGVATKWAVFAPLLWLSSYEYSGRWLHLARVDSLFVLLLLAALYGMRFWETRRLTVVTGVLMWLAFLTKQSAAMTLFPVGLAILAIDFRRGLVIGGVFTALAGLSILVLNGLTDGWFWYYAFDVPARHGLAPQHFAGFWRWDVLRMPMLFAVALPTLGLLATTDRATGLFYAGLCIGAFAASWSSRLHIGGAENVIMPVYLALCLVAPLGLSILETRLADGERERVRTSPTVIGLFAVVAVQLALGIFPLRNWIPSDEQYAQGELMMRYLAEVDGEVLLPDHRWVQTEVGQPSFGLGMAAKDILRLPPGEDPGRDAFVESMSAAFAEQRFSQVILSEDIFMREQLARHYCYAREIPGSPEPITGWRIRPMWVWVAKGPDTVLRGGRRSHECPDRLQRRARP